VSKRGCPRGSDGGTTESADKGDPNEADALHNLRSWLTIRSRTEWGERTAVGGGRTRGRRRSVELKSGELGHPLFAGEK